ncbi:MAG TPA: hypothetical protein VM531_07285 [Sphingomicrobium sp.]|jgi:hypothetical protein|nr:hypothetical protein [Sphingomicrobium sp.]
MGSRVETIVNPNIRLKGVDASPWVHESVGETRWFRMNDGWGNVVEFTGKLAYTEDFDLTIVDIRPGGG